LTKKTIIERNFWNLINVHKVTNFGGVPFTFEILKKIKFQNLNLPSLKHITQAGGKLKKELSIEFEKILGKKKIKFFRMYGSTEATSRMAYMPANLNKKHPESIGFAIPGGKLWLQDKKKKKITSINTVGEVVYKGSNVCLGYANSKKDLKRGDKNKGILLTGDLGTIDQNKLIFIIGRKKRFLKVFGLRVNLDELETILNNLGYKCLCSGVDNKLKIYFLKKFKKDSSDVIEKISNITKINKSVFKIEFIDKFPRNQSGKILYNKLN
jgi:acyl-coenzyme A synthetase/AMP-(fatty) acid ligase